MSTHAARTVFSRLLPSLLSLLFALPGLSQVSSSGPVVVNELQHDISPPLIEIQPVLGAESPTAPRVLPWRHTQPLVTTKGAAQPGGALQNFSGPKVNTTPGLNFDGVGADGFAPSDSNAAAGATQVVEWVNSEFAIYDKSTGNLVFGPAAGNTLWSGFAGPCATNNDGDIIAQYDKLASRWVLAQPVFVAGSYTYCLAVSTTSDATGSFNRYAFSLNPNFPDYPKLGVWPDAYYASFNMFDPTGTFFLGAQACAYNRVAMLAGTAATAVCFQRNSSVDSLLPSDLDGTTAPLAGSPDFFVDFTTNALRLWQFHVDFTTPSNSTFTGPTTIPVASFNTACGGGTCIPQLSSGGTLLDSLGDRLMYRFAYRNFGTHESLVVSHSVTAGASVGVRWYELRSPSSSPVVFQQGTFAPDSKYRWMPSIAMDSAGDIAVGYSVSSSSMHPAISYSGRIPSDPPGTLETETSIVAGGGSQNAGLTRWGDYSSMSVDPVDDCTFWYTNQYLQTTGSFNWSTRLASFKFTGCGAATPDFTLTGSPSSQTVVQGGFTTYTATVAPLNGFSGNVTLGVSGLPSGATGVFSPTSVTGSGSSTLTVTTSSTTPTGTYTLTLTGTSGSLSHSTTVTLVVNSSNLPDFTISATPSSKTITHGSSAFYTITVTALNGFTGNVTFSMTGVPSGGTSKFRPTSVKGSGTANTLIGTSSSTAAGTYTLTITGTSGALSHSTTVSLVVH